MAVSGRAIQGGWAAERVRWEPLLLVLLPATALLVAAELFVQRVAVRVGIHIPAAPELQEPYSVVTESGSVLFPAATLMVLVALGATALYLAGTLPRNAGLLALASLAPFPLVGAYAGVSERHAELQSPLTFLYVLAIVPLASAAIVTCAPRHRLLLLGLVAVLAASAVATLPEFSSARSGIELTRAAEAAAMALGVAAPFVLLRSWRSKKAAVLAAVAALFVVAMLLGNRSTTNILMLWALGMPGGMPVVVYALAAAGLSYAAFRLLAEGRTLAAIGLLLVAMGGIGLHNTYQSSLQVLGLCVLLVALANPPEEPAPEAIPLTPRS